eukprot:874054-Prorocentrum_minimum.AAC.1
MALLRRALALRCVELTERNPISSRSHAVCELRLLRECAPSSGECAPSSGEFAPSSEKSAAPTEALKQMGLDGGDGPRPYGARTGARFGPAQ